MRVIASSLLVMVAFGGCLDEAGVEVGESEPRVSASYRIDEGDRSLVIRDESLRATAAEAKMFGLRFDVEGNTTLSDLEIRMDGTRTKQLPMVGVYWFFLWKMDEEEPALRDIFAVGQHYGEVAMFADANGPEVRVNYPYGMGCDVLVDCESSGSRYSSQEDIHLEAGNWWLLFGKTSDVTYDLEIRINFGTDQVTPKAFYLGTSCETLGHWDMGGTIRLYTLYGPSWFEDLHMSFPTKDHLFLLRMQYPTGQFEEEIHMPNGTVFESFKELDDETRTQNWPGIAYTDEGDGEVNYSMPHGSSAVLSTPIILSYCTFSNDDLIYFGDDNGA